MFGDKFNLSSSFSNHTVPTYILVFIARIYYVSLSNNVI
jgi:hypothetical protein